MLPLTMLPAMAEGEATPATIKNAKMFAKYSDDYAMHPLYGSVNGMIDGDKYDESRSEADYSRYPYYYSDKDVAKNTSLYIDSIGQTRTYYGYALFELNAMSELDDVTIWLAADGNSDGAAAAWSNPTATWNMNNAYDILVSEDGESWTLMGEYDDMCGTGSAKGAGWTAQESAGNIESVEKDGYTRLGHKVNLDGERAKYVAVAVSEYINDKNDKGIPYAQIVIGEVSVCGTNVSSASAKTPAEIYADASNGELLKAVNFDDASWSDDYANMNNWNSYYIVTDGGLSVEHLLHSEWTFYANNKRAMWGGIAESERFSLGDDNKYTLIFDMTFGESSDKFGCGIQVDSDDTLLIDGAGNSYWYKWNDQKVGRSSSNKENWTENTDKDATATQTFAVEIDTVAESMTLSVKNTDGSFSAVRMLTFDGADIDGTLACRIYIRNLNDAKPGDNSCIKISNLQIYKGYVVGATPAVVARVERVKMIATYSDGWALHPLYGSVAGMIDGDAYNTGRSKNSDYPYFWSTPDACQNTSLYVNSIDETRTYYGYALFELNAPSALDDVTIWLAADGHTESAAAAWSDPTKSWNINNAYDILVSEDGESWTLMGEYDDMCGDGSAAGAGWSAQESAGNIVSVIKGGYERLGHKVDLNGVTAKYVAVAVKECTNETSEGNYLHQIVIGEVSVNGLTTEPVVGEKTPTEIYEETEDGDLLYSVNFKDTTYSDDYYNSNNYFSYYILSEDGTAVKHGLTKDKFNTNNSKRARWGGIASDKRFTLTDEERYTIYFDAKFAGVTESFGIGVQVDPDDTLILDGAGNSYWYCWNTQKTGKSDNADENWLSKAGGDITKVHSFAIELNPHTDEMTLYVAGDGCEYNKVRTLTWYEGEGNSAYLNGLLECSIFALSIDGTEAGELTNCEISDLSIYKGLVASESGHEYDEGTITQAPTCKAEGVLTKTCIHCSAVITEAIPAGDHNYGPWTETESATCQKDGTKEQKCTVCSDTKTDKIPMLQHNYGAAVVTKEATCIEAGVKTRTCTLCKEATITENTPLGAHKHGDWVITKEATCTEEGVKEKICTVCGGDKVEEAVSANGHDLDEGTETTAPDCESTGVLTKKCKNCTYTETEVIPATGHKYDEGSVTKQPTCTEEGTMGTGTCERCGDTLDNKPIPALGHDYDEEVTKAPGCETTGVLTKTCQREGCGHIEEVEIPAIGHNYGEWVVTDPTCTEDGYKTQTCANCGNVVTEAGAPATGHNYGAWEFTPPTCTVDGVKTKTCVNCDDVVTEAGDAATGHNHGAWATTKNATCTETGIKEKKCACGDTITETIPVTGHNYGAWEITPPTCTEAGVKTKTCINCGDVITEAGDAATGHNHGAWEVTKEATCTETGIKEKKCACGDAIAETFRALGHNRGAWVVTKEATCNETGTKEKKCTRCDDTVTETIDKLEHNYGEWVVTKEATATEEGVKTKTCALCGDKITESIDKLPPEETVAPETEAPETTPETEPEAKKGCGGSIAMSGVALVGACAAMLALKRRKNEDD